MPLSSLSVMLMMPPLFNLIFPDNIDIPFILSTYYFQFGALMLHVCPSRTTYKKMKFSLQLLIFRNVLFYVAFIFLFRKNLKASPYIIYTLG